MWTAAARVITRGVGSFIGAESGGEGVKLEQRVLNTDDGHRLMSSYPFDEALSAREV